MTWQDTNSDGAVSLRELLAACTEVWLGAAVGKLSPDMGLEAARRKLDAKSDRMVSLKDFFFRLHEQAVK